MEYSATDMDLRRVNYEFIAECEFYVRSVGKLEISLIVSIRFPSNCAADFVPSGFEQMA